MESDMNMLMILSKVFQLKSIYQINWEIQPSIFQVKQLTNKKWEYISNLFGKINIDIKFIAYSSYEYIPYPLISLSLSL